MINKINLDINAIVSALTSSATPELRELWDPTGETIQGDSYILVQEGFVSCILNVRVFKPFLSEIIRRDFVTFQFMQSSGRYYHHAGDKSVPKGAGTVSLTATPISRTESKGDNRPSTARGIALHVARDKLVELFGLQPVFWRNEYQEAFGSASGNAVTIDLPLTPEMWMAMDAMLNCEFEPPVRANYLRAKSIELLSLAVVEFNRIDLPGGTVPLSALTNEAKRIDIAALIYRRELRAPPSVDELGRRVGLNRNKLTNGFKKLFGRAPAEYSRQVRLEWAERRISEGLSVQKAASEAGYESVAAFGRAFREKYGRSPSTRGDKAGLD